MPPKDLYPVECVEPDVRIAGDQPQPLPLLAAPIVDEALPAWLHRFAEPLPLSPADLLLADEPEDLPMDDTWWRRPSAAVLARLAARTGTQISVLKTMTFSAWQEHRGEDEALRRFSRLRVRAPRLPVQVTRRFGVCSRCLECDVIPYVRKHWTLGWMVACEQHGLQLHTSCQRCGAGFMLPLLKSRSSFSLRACTRCDTPLARQAAHLAHPCAIRLQELLRTGRAADEIRWPGVGRLTWATAVALIDIVLSVAHSGSWSSQDLVDTPPSSPIDRFEHFRADAA